MEKNKLDNNNIGNAGEYYIASILSSKGFIATITLGRAEAYDIIAINPKGNTIKIQVKTSWYNTNSFMLSYKDVKEKNSNDYYAFVTLKQNKETWDYFVVPADIVSKFINESHNNWLKTLGKKGQKHNDNPLRKFEIKPNIYSPKWFDENFMLKYKNNIDIL
jgi:Holliday junction resolvase